MIPSERLARRIASASVIQLANKYVGGGWNLVHLTEGDVHTRMVFHLDFPFRSSNGIETTETSEVVITISAPTAPDVSRETCRLCQRGPEGHSIANDGHEYQS